MKRWEFGSIAQAASCLHSWFSGTPAEQQLLREYLDSILGTVSFHIHKIKEQFSLMCTENYAKIFILYLIFQGRSFLMLKKTSQKISQLMIMVMKLHCLLMIILPTTSVTTLVCTLEP